MLFHMTHPGAVLKEELEARNITPSAAAIKLRVPSQRLYEIVRGDRGISSDTALRLARFFGMSAEFWMNLQTNYDLSVTRRQKGDAIEREVEMLPENVPESVRSQVSQ